MQDMPLMPFWMTQRQLKAEIVSENTLRMTGPNLPTHDISIMPVSMGPGWRVTIHRVGNEGERQSVMQTEVPFASQSAAWQSAFELYRQHVIV